uniref:Immunoglobulin domain-containing protein n=1 Tax=Cyprinus carpio TaxID=7962 RepID=A0A8C1S9Z6_CYPCA
MVLALVLLHLWLWHFNGVFGVEAGVIKSLSVMEGDSVTLHTDTDTQRNDAVIQWMFGAQNPDIVIAEINRDAQINDVTDERFRDRVKMDSQTGSLTITNIRTTDSGLYKVELTTNSEAEKTFNVTVYGEYSSRIWSFLFRSILTINLNKVLTDFSSCSDVVQLFFLFLSSSVTLHNALHLLRVHQSLNVHCCVQW